MNKNIKYKSNQILEFYSRNRQRWRDFYPSEKWVFEKIIENDGHRLGDVLDIGCACGGLGVALNERFVLNSYTGVDVHKEAINCAEKKQNLNIPIHFIWADILELDLNEQYDTVVSLSCADFNIETSKIIKRCWSLLKSGGYFIASLRLTEKKGINNIKTSYQYINFSGKERHPEICNYVVFNLRDILILLGGLKPSPKLIGAYGYWGKPSPTARTPFKKLVFAVFYIKKDSEGLDSKTVTKLNLPLDFLCNCFKKNE